MERHEIDEMPCEANGHTPYHLLQKDKADRVAKILDINARERIDEHFRDVEPGQNYGAFGLLGGFPINTLR